MNNNNTKRGESVDTTPQYKYLYPETDLSIRDIAGSPIHAKSRLEIDLVLWASTRIDLRKLGGANSGNLNNLLQQLCICANEYENGYFCYPGFRALKQRTGIKSMDTIQTLIHKLWLLQLIAVYRRKGKGAAGSFLYEIHKDAIPEPRSRVPENGTVSVPDIGIVERSNCSRVQNIKRTNIEEKENQRLQGSESQTGSGNREPREKGNGKDSPVGKDSFAPDAIDCRTEWANRGGASLDGMKWGDYRTVGEVEEFLTRCNDAGIPWRRFLIDLFHADNAKDINAILGMKFRSPRMVLRNWDALEKAIYKGNNQ